jgi:hypothetical protein
VLHDGTTRRSLTGGMLMAHTIKLYSAQQSEGQKCLAETLEKEEKDIGEIRSAQHLYFVQPCEADLFAYMESRSVRF